MKVLFCASEVTPFAKTGGLADVAGSLPVALGELGVDVAVMMPRYRGIRYHKKKMARRVEAYFVDHESYFNRSSLYGNEKGDYPDNLKRFSFFCHQALFLAKQIGFRPDIVHAHDWQTALLSVILKTKSADDPFFQKTKSLLTIHNLAYQGVFPYSRFSDTEMDPSLFSVEGFEFYGKVNLLKAGILFADAISTVSTGYAREILTKEYGCALEGVLALRKNRLSGILNGIDTKEWDPKRDGALASTYSSKTLLEKRANKSWLQNHFKLAPSLEKPLLAMVSRLVDQKGLDILLGALDALAAKEVQFILLGEGEKQYHSAFLQMAKRHPHSVGVHLGFDSQLAHKVYAGADFIMMPSIFEPCGLGQMIGLRYGTIPIVRRTGGLADTVVDAAHPSARGNGFVFTEPTSPELYKCVERAAKFYANKKSFRDLQANAMKQDFSWQKSAQDYVNLYKKIMGNFE